MPFQNSIHFVVTTFLAAGLVPDKVHKSKPLSDCLIITAAVQSYKIQTGSLPNSELGLGALAQESGAPNREQEGIKPFRAVPKDPWGREYRYVAGAGYPGGFGIYSTGPDGVTDTQGNDPDDLNSWSDDNRGIQTGMRRHWFNTVLLVIGSTLFGLLSGVFISRIKKRQAIA